MLTILGLGLDDSLEPRKVSQGMVGQVIALFLLIDFRSMLESPQVSF